MNTIKFLPGLGGRQKASEFTEAMVQQLCLTAQRWYLDPANMEIHPRVQELHVALWNDTQGFMPFCSHGGSRKMSTFGLVSISGWCLEIMWVVTRFINPSCKQYMQYIIYIYIIYYYMLYMHSILDTASVTSSWNGNPFFATSKES